MKINLKKVIIWAKELFPLNRSLTGSGNFETLNYLKKINKRLKLKYSYSNKIVFDWKIPKVWNVKSASLKDEYGNLICSFERNNLELVGYSIPIKKKFTYYEILPHLHYLKKQPSAIPYVTSYYKKNWGFCLTYKKFKKLNKNIKYIVDIDTSFSNGKMYYGEIFLKGQSKKEILVTTYICHPSMANNELSGILATLYLSKIIKSKKYSIRFLFIPETIGAINYINKNLGHLKKNLIAGINISCVGLGGPYTIINSIYANTYSDIISRRIGKKYINFKELKFQFRGSNERQFGCQNLDLPFITFCRKRFGDYKEYHTSLDNLDIMNYKELINSINFVRNFINEIQNNQIFIKNKICEPFLTKYNLVESVGTRENMKNKNRAIASNIIAYVNRKYDLYEIAKSLKENIQSIKKISSIIKKKRIIKEVI